MADQFDRDDVESVAACLGDDASQLREENDEDERAANMDRAASMLTWMLLTHPAYAGDDGAEASNRLVRSVFLDLLAQVRKFCEEQGEAEFWTGPAEALRWTLEGRTPPQHLQSALAKFILLHPTSGVGGNHGR